MEMKYIAATAGIVVLVFFFAGGAISEQCTDIDGCRRCWKTTVAVVTSELCGENETCLAQPEDQQNNAIVDSVLCGCENARESGYSNTRLNRQIEDVTGTFTGFNVTVNNVCEQPGFFFTKNSYV